MHDLLDLDRFALDRPGSADWSNLVSRCQADLQRNGMFNLDQLLRPEAAAQIVASLTPMFRSEAFHHTRTHNIYFSKSISGLAPDHPAQARAQTSNRTLGADQLEGTILPRLYEWQPLRQFLSACMGKPRLHLMADPLARANVMSYQAGEGLNWHFDRSEFTTTLLLQAPLKGGVFEFRSNLRHADDPNYEGVAQLLLGNDPELRDIVLTAGTLNVFRGRNTAHRVTPVEGPVARVIAVFSYFERDGVMFSDEERIGFYGRTS